MQKYLCYFLTRVFVQCKIMALRNQHLTSARNPINVKNSLSDREIMNIWQMFWKLMMTNDDKKYDRPGFWIPAGCFMQMHGCFWELQEYLEVFFWTWSILVFSKFVEWVTVTGVKSVTVIPKLSLAVLY